MTIQPIEHAQLIGYKDLFDTFVSLYKKQKLPNKIILSGRRGIGKSTFAYHFINYVFSIDEDFKYNLENFQINELNNSFNKVKSNLHPNFFLIDMDEEKKSIEVEKIRKLITYSQKQSFDNKIRFVLINNIEFLNLNAANALLKILEEPNDNLFFILIHDDSKKILDTIKSRCIIFKKAFDLNETISIVNEVIKDDIYNYLNNDFIDNYSTVGELVHLFHFSNENKINLKENSLKNFIQILIDDKNFNKNKELLALVFDLLEKYFYKNFLNTKNIDIYKLYKKFSKKKYITDKYNLDMGTLLLEIRSEVLSA